MKRKTTRSTLLLLAALGGLGAVVTTAPEARAQEPAPAPAAPVAPAPAAPAPAADDWDARYEAAYKALVEGRLRFAASAFHELARTARSDRDRTVAHEMARLATEEADAADARAGITRVAPTPYPIRSTDELALLYASGFLYGAGSGVWFLLATEPDSAITATLPFAAIAAAPVIAIATVDGLRPLPRTLPHSISAGLYLGLGESVWAVGFQAARAERIQQADPSSDQRFRPETVAAVLWGGATAGAVLGGALGTGLRATPGRVSFTASTTLWSGVLTGLLTGAVAGDPRRSERAYLVGGVGYNLGLAGGLLFAGDVSPSVARVRIVDLFALAGGLATTGLYLTATQDVDVRAAEGLAAAGIGAGIAAGWLATSGMGREAPDASAAPRAAVQPTVLPVPAGAALGIGGAF